MYYDIMASARVPRVLSVRLGSQPFEFFLPSPRGVGFNKPVVLITKSTL